MNKVTSDTNNDDIVKQIQTELNNITSLISDIKINSSERMNSDFLLEIKLYVQNIEKISKVYEYEQIEFLSSDMIIKLESILINKSSKYVLIEVSNYIANVNIFLSRITEQFITKPLNEVFEVSNEIKTLFIEETNEHLKKLNNILIQIDKDKSKGKKLLDDFYREIHSIKGDSNALGFYRIAEISHIIETNISDLKISNQIPNDKFIDFLFDSIDNLSNLVSEIVNGTYKSDSEINSISSDNSNNRVDKKNKDIKNKSDLVLESIEDIENYENVDIPDEMKILYGQEANDHINNISKLFFNIENYPESQKEYFIDVYRELHSLKGDSNALGLENIGKIAHQMETIITSLQKNDSNITSDLLETLTNKLQVMSKIISKITGVSIDTNEQFIFEDKKTDIESESVDNDIPEEIKEIYISETSEHIFNIENFLIVLESDEAKLIECMEKVYRELHSIKGDSNTLGFNKIGDIAHKFETLITKIQKQDLDYNTNTLNQIFDSLNILKNTFSNETNYKFIEENEKTPEYDLTNNIVIDNIEIPEEIRSLYGEESKEHINNIYQVLINLENDKDSQKENLELIYRELHSVKGDSSALGLNKISSIAHQMESIITSIQKDEKELDNQIIHNLIEHLEILKQSILKAININIEPQEKETEEEQESYDNSLSDEMKEIYINETQEHITKISSLLLEIEETKNIEIFNELYREFHSIKGDSNALGFSKIGVFAHELETLITNSQKKQYFEKSDLDNFYLEFEQMKVAFNKILGIKKEVNTVRQTINNKKDTIILNYKEDSLKEKETRITNNKKLLEDSLRVTNNKSKNTINNKTTLNKTTGNNKKSAFKSIDETIRVSTSKIDKIINLSDELLITKIGYDHRVSEISELIENLTTYKSSIKNIITKANENKNTDEDLIQRLINIQDDINTFSHKLNSNLKDLKKDTYTLSLLVDQIQSDSRNTRMLTASYLIEPLKIVVRNTSKKLNKSVFLHVSGEEIEIDRSIIERLKDPLSHIVRNSLDHGIESAEERKIKNKPSEAKLIIDVSISGNNIIFKISDDGRGINYHKISAKAVKLGIIAEEQSSYISEGDLNKIMFAPGFSTTEKITDVSGRGVGLDVVKSTIESIGGTISVVSVFGEGSSFILSVPLTLTTFDSILVNISGNKYALPKQFIQSTITITLDKIITNGINKEILIDNRPVRLLEFSTILEEKKSEFTNEITVVVLESSDFMAAFIVDDFIESRKMVMKPLGSQILKVPNISGATIMGDGEPVLVLNPIEILNTIFSESFKIDSLDIKIVDSNKEAKRAKVRILVVDDSITTRTLEKNILESAGYEVVIGKNGLEGKEGVEKYSPDLIITDVEMPKMNGYQFASWVKKESTYSNTPVIMISSLATPELKQKGYDSGIDAYIVKGEFNQNKLLETINKLLN
ncbi:MAG: Hpt domain-containing protein [Candidatus Sericytochromatia bacterium]